MSSHRIVRSQGNIFAWLRREGPPQVLSALLILGFLVPTFAFGQEGTENVDGGLNTGAQTPPVQEQPQGSVPVQPTEQSAEVAPETGAASVDSEEAAPVDQDEAAEQSADTTEEVSGQESMSAMSGPLSGDDPYRLSREALSPSNFFYGNFSGGPFTYSYPIIIPPGRNGVQPDLKLNYSSDSKKNDSIFGYGWGISIPYIERVNKIGSDKLFNQDRANSYFYSSLSGELLPLLSTSTVGSTLGFSIRNWRLPKLLAQLDDPFVQGVITSEAPVSSGSSSNVVVGDSEYIQVDVAPSVDVAPTSEQEFIQTGTTTPEVLQAIDNTQKISLVATTSSSTTPLSDLLFSLDAKQRANLKGEAIASLQNIKKTVIGDYEIAVESMEPIDGGVQVFARAWNKEGGQIGFGPDGSVDIERFRIFNPPIFVDDPAGDIVRTTVDFEGIEIIVRLRESPEVALLQTLEHAISVKQEKFDSSLIQAGKIGNTTSIFYPAEGANSPADGHTEWTSGGGTSSWTTARTNAGTAASVTDTAPRAAAGTVNTSGSYESLQRGVFMFDTSPLSGSVVLSATLALTPDSITDTWSASNNIIIANPASANTLSSSDHQNFTFTRLSTDRAVTSMSAGSSSDYVLNATGVTHINATGTSKFGFAMVYDIDGTAPPTTSNSGCRLHIRMAEASANDPKLIVEHSVPVASPVNPLTNGAENPSGVTTTSPYFSAVHQNGSTTALAASYQIQFSTSSNSWSSPYWDSGRNTLSSSTPPGMRTPNIFSTTTLALDGMKYYWRIRLWDQSSATGTWSTATSTFIMQIMGDYSAKVDDGSFIRYTLQSDNSWMAKDKRGWIYIFGTSSGSRIDNPATTTEISRWMLTEVRDPNGNGIKYSYAKDGGQIYPSAVDYTDANGSAPMGRVEFVRSLRPSMDQATSSVYGFPVGTRYRITEINAKWGGINGSTVRKYQFSYGTGDDQARTVLSSIQQTGYPENASTTATVLPSVTFSYHNSTTTWTESSSYQAVADFTNSAGADLGNRLLDVNGDALPDWVRNNGTSYIALNTGTLWDTAGAGSNGWTVPVAFSDGTNDYGVRFADVNIDGLTDIIAASSTKIVYLNNGTSTWVASSTWGFPESFIDVNKRDLGVQIADVNGDGLVDVLRSHYGTSTGGTTTRAYIHHGYGWSLDPSWTTPEIFIDEVSGAQHDFGVRLMDITGDGLLDLVRSGKNPTIQRVYVNTGRGWQLDSTIAVPEYFADTSVTLALADLGVRMADFSGDGQSDMAKAQIGTTRRTDVGNLGLNWVYATGTLPEDFNDGSGKDYGVRLDDVDGDGQLDVVRGHDRTSEGQGDIKKIYLKNGVVPDLMKQVTTEHGGILTIAYQGSPKYATGTTALNQRLPFVYQAVSAIGVDSGVGLGQHRVTATTTFSYANGIYYAQNFLDRKFPGFGSITKTNDKGEVVRTYFHQGDASTTQSQLGEFNDHIAKAGRAYRTEVLTPTSGGLSPLQSSLVKWARAEYADGRNFVKPVQLTTFAYHPNNSSLHRDSAQTFIFDDSTGNVSTRMHFGEVSATDSGGSVGVFTDIGTDGATTTYSYAASSTNVVMSIPSRALVTDQTGATISDQKWTYDGLSFGSASKGNPTKEERLISGSTYASTTRTFNSYGLVTLAADPRGGTTTYVYDVYNLYPATTTNALGHTIVAQYDYSSGKPATTTDENALKWVTDLDGLDRPIREKIPDLVTPSTLVLKTEYSYSDSPGNQYATTTSSTSTLAADNFNAGSGNLDGSTGGSGWLSAWYGTHGQYVNFTFQGTTVFEGAKAIELTNDAETEPEIQRNFPGVASGTMRFAMRRDSTTVDGSNIMFGVSSPQGIGRAISVQMSYGNFSIEDGNTPVSIGTYNVNQWYDIEVEFDCSTDKHRVRIDGGTWSSWYNFKTPKTTIGNVVLSIGSGTAGSSSNYWDNISVVTGGVSWVTSYPLPASVFRRDYLSSATSTDAYTYMDGFDRPITVRKESETPNVWITKETLYNTQSLTDMDSVPYFIATSSYAAPTTTGAFYTSYQYDALGRVTSANDIFGTVSNTYDRWGVFTRDPLGNVKAITRDAYGNLTQVDEQDGVATRTTAYLWNRLGKLTKLTDALGNVRNFTYDNSGRLLISEDLHTTADTGFGTTTYTYDIAGNLTQKLTPRGHTVTYTYDTLNRMKTEDYTGLSGTEVSYFYDTCTYGKTRLCSARKQGEATTTYAYNAMGLASAEGKTIGLGSTAVTSTTSFLYFRNGREQRVLYPDIAQVHYLYDNAGLLDKVLNKESGGATTTIVSRITYTPLEQVEALDQGNGVSATSTYDQTKKYRLTQKLSKKGTTTLQYLTYGYDAVGNITNVNEYASTSARKSVVYTYDPLYRLLSASTTAVATGTASYKESFMYDALGNLLSKTSVLGSTTTVTTIPNGYIPSAATSFETTSGTAAPTDGNTINGTGDGSGWNGSWVTGGSDDTEYDNSQSSLGTWSALQDTGDSEPTAERIFTSPGTTTGRISFSIRKNKVDRNTNGVMFCGGVCTTSGYRAGVMYFTPMDLYNGTGGNGDVAAASSTSDIVIADNFQAADTWYAVDLDFNVASDTYDVYIDGVKKNGSPLGFYAAQSQIDRVQLFTGAAQSPGEGDTPGSKSWVDNLRFSTQIGTTTSTTTLPVVATTTYQYIGTNYANPHAATQVGSTTFTYDNSGNMLTETTSGTTTGYSHTYDYRDRLASSLRYSDELSITYGYDHTGARVRMKDATTTSYFGKLYQQTNGGYKKTKNIYVGSQLVATIEKQGTAAVIPYYVLSDNLSSVTMLTNASGTATQTLDYFPFGGVRVNSKNTSYDSQRKYIGQLMDSSTNLDYLNARYYDASRGQFTSQDPLSRNIGLNPTDRLLLNPQEQNMYSYALNNPIRLSDPSGEAVSLASFAASLASFAAQLQSFVSSLASYVSNSSSQGGGGGSKSTPAQQSKQNPTPTTSGGGGNPVITPARTLSNQAYNQKLTIYEEENLLTKRYEFGRKGPDAFDCSGAITYSIRNSGINPDFGDYSAHQLYEKYSSPSDNSNRGTVNFYDYTGDGTIDHVTTNQGDGNMIHPSQNKGIIYSREASSFYDAIKKENSKATMTTMQLNWGIIAP